MGKPILRNGRISHAEYIGVRREPGEVKHLSNQRRRKKLLILSIRLLISVGYFWSVYSLSSGERKGNSPNLADLVQVKIHLWVFLEPVLKVVRPHVCGGLRVIALKGAYTPW
jgi:hypothetical protein